MINVNKNDWYYVVIKRERETGLISGHVEYYDEFGNPYPQAFPINTIDNINTLIGIDRVGLLEQIHIDMLKATMDTQAKLKAYEDFAEDVKAETETKPNGIMSFVKGLFQ